MSNLLRVRKVADMEGLVVVNNEAGGTVTIDTKTGQPAQRPLKGVQPEGELPEETAVGTAFVNRAIAEGWAELVGSKPVFRPAGPATDKWSSTHSFTHAEAVIFHF